MFIGRQQLDSQLHVAIPPTRHIQSPLGAPETLGHHLPPEWTGKLLSGPNCAARDRLHSQSFYQSTGYVIFPRITTGPLKYLTDTGTRGFGTVLQDI